MKYRLDATLTNQEEHPIAGLKPRFDQILCPFVIASIRTDICSIVGRGLAAVYSQKPNDQVQNLTKACLRLFKFTHSSADSLLTQDYCCRNYCNLSSQKVDHYYHHF